jgi:hypothetical protein
LIETRDKDETKDLGDQKYRDRDEDETKDLKDQKYRDEMLKLLEKQFKEYRGAKFICEKPENSRPKE